MRKIKKILSALLVLAMLMSMVVLPVSAKNVYNYTMQVDKVTDYGLAAGDEALFYFTPQESGWYIFYGPRDGEAFGWALYGSLGTYYQDIMDVTFWRDPTEKYFGIVFYANAYQSYTCQTINSGSSYVESDLTVTKALPLETFTISQTTATGQVGESLSLCVEVGPQFAYEPVTWTSSNPDVVEFWDSYNMEGRFSLRSAGTATITATTESGLEASCDVTVTGEAIESGTLDFTLIPGVEQGYTLNPGEEAFFHFTAAETGWHILCGPRSGEEFGWALYDGAEEDYSKMIDVNFWRDPTETYFGTVIYTEAGKTYTCKVASDSSATVSSTLKLIKAEPYDTFNISQTEAEGFVGETLRLTVEVGPQFAYEPITWQSSDPAVAEFWDFYNTEGRFALRYEGTATITATTESGLSAACNATVTFEPQPEVLHLNTATTATVPAGGTVTYLFQPYETRNYLFYIPRTDGIELYAQLKGSDEMLPSRFWGNSGSTETWHESDYVGEVFGMTAREQYLISVVNTSDTPRTVSLCATSIDCYSYLELPKTLTGDVGETLRVYYSWFPAQTSSPVSWSVSDSSVARIVTSNNAYADLELVGSGTATLTLNGEYNVKATCKITALDMERIEGDSFDVHVAKGGYTELLFTTGETGDYLFYQPKSAAGQYYVEAKELESGTEPVISIWRDQDEYTLSGTSFEMEANTTYIITVHNYSETAEDGTVFVTKRGPYESISIESVSTCTVGETIDLKAVGSPVFGKDTVIWSNQNPEVIEILSMGLMGITLKGIAPGTATITATTESGVSASCEITVTEIPVEVETADPIVLDQPIAVVVPTSEKIKYAFTPEEDGTYIFHTDAQNSPQYVLRTAAGGTVLTGTRWLHPTSVGEGYAYSLSAGTTYIVELENRYLYPGISCNFAVNKAELYQSLEITGDSVAFTGKSASLWISGAPTFAMETLSCTSSDPAIAQVASASNSYVTLDCLSPGTVTITVTAPGGASVSHELTVKQPLTLTQDKALPLQIPYGAEEVVEFTPAEDGRYILYCANGTDLDLSASPNDGSGWCTPVDWENADGTLRGCSFDMTGGKTYTVTVRNFDADPSADVQLTVVKAENYTSLSFPQDSYTGRVGAYIRLKIASSPEFASEKVTWSSSDSSVVKVNNYSFLNHYVELLAPGEATVTVSTADGRVSASCKFTVTDKPVLQLGEGVPLTIPYNGYEVLTFTAPEDGRYIFYHPGDTHYHAYAYEPETYEDLEAVQWQNGEKTLSGYVFDMLGGHQYEVTLHNYSQEAGLTTTLTTVKAEKYESLRLDQTEIATRINSFHQLKLISTPEFAHEDVTWTCSDPDMLSIFSDTSMGAEVFVKAGGTATVTATTASGLSASCVVTTQHLNSFVLNETREVQLYADTPYTRLYFTAPESGTYSFYKNSQVPIAVTADDPNTGEEFKLDFYFKGNFHVADLELEADQTVCFVLHYHEDTDEIVEVGVGQPGPVQEIRLSHTDIVVAPLSGVLLEQILLPVVCYDEKITVTSSDELIAAYLETATEENYTCHLVATFEELGTAFITVTAENGATATCKVTVMESEDITLGTVITPILPAGGYFLYKFTPSASGTYTIFDNAADSVLDMHVVNSSIRGKDYSTGTAAGSKLALGTSDMAWISVKNDSDTAQAFTITLAEGYHEHVPYFVPEQAPGYTTPGMQAHCACPCGALFLDDAGTMPVSEEELLIPQLVPVEGNQAKISHEVIADAAEKAEGSDIVLPLTGASEVTSAALPASALAQVADMEKTLTLELTAAAVTMDSAALANAAEKAGDAQITLEVKKIPAEDLTESQMAAIEALEQTTVQLLSIELTANGRSIANEAAGGFGIGKAMVQIPVKLAGDTYTVLYLADDGSATVIENTTYENGILTMELEHFSTYAILQDCLPGDTNDDGKITILDLMRLANHFAKNAEINEANADVNADGKITILDLMRLANYFAGKAQLGA